MADKAVAERPISPLSFHKYLNEDKLMGTKCKKCGAVYTPPRLLCINCYGREMDWVQMSGKGKLFTFTVITIAPPWMIAQGYDRNHPYISGVVELEEGCKIDARIEGVDPNKPEQIKIGSPMKVKFIHRQEGDHTQTYLSFEPV